MAANTSSRCPASALVEWRAQIARVPGGCAALMPFYGKTPDEAAGQLSRWLALLHGQSQQAPLRR